MNKELKTIVNELHKQGFDTKVRNNGHVAVYKGSEYVATFGGTPSDSRSVKNSLAKCKRAGFRWPP